MQDLKGNPMSLAEYQGKAILIQDSSEECGLTKELDQMGELQATYGDKGLVCIGIPCAMIDPNDDLLGNYIKDTPVKLAKHLSTPKLFSWLKTHVAPMSRSAPKPKHHDTLYLIDKTGRVAGHWTDPTLPNDIIADIEKVLA